MDCFSNVNVGSVPVACLTGEVRGEEELEAGGRGGGHGLDKDITFKLAAKFSNIQEAKVPPVAFA